MVLGQLDIPTQEHNIGLPTSHHIQKLNQNKLYT